MSLKEALGLIKKGQYAEALEAVREAYQANPEDGKALLVVALCNFKLGALEAAEKAYRKAAGSDAVALQAYLGLSSVYEARGNEDQLWLESLEHACDLLREADGKAMQSKLEAALKDRINILVRLERFTEAWALFSEQLENKDAISIMVRVAALEGRQKEQQVEAVAALELGSFTAKERVGKEADIHAMLCLPTDLIDLYQAILKDETVTKEEKTLIRAKFARNIFESKSSGKLCATLLWPLLQSLSAELESSKCPEDWQWMEVVVLLHTADNFCISAEQSTQIGSEYCRRFTHRPLARLMQLALAESCDLKELNAALLLVPQYLAGWEALLDQYASKGQWKYVQVGSGKAIQQLASLATQTGGLAFHRSEANLLVRRASAVSGDAAEGDLRTALALYKDHPGARIELAKILFGGDDLKKQEALSLVQGLASAEAQALEGKIMLSQGRAQDAIALLEPATTAHPADGALRLALGRALRMAKVAGALQQLLLAVKCSPGNAAAWAELGDYFALDAKEGDRARRAHGKAFAIDTTLADSGKYVSDALYASGDEDGSARVAASVLEATPLCGWAALRVGRRLVEIGRPAAALQAFQRLIRADPENPLGWEGLGDTYREQGKFMASLQAYGKATELAPDRWLSYYRAGSVLRVLGASEEALEELAKAETRRPEFVPIVQECVRAGLDAAEQLERLGMVTSAQGRLETACKDAERLAELGGGYKGLVDVWLAKARLDRYDGAKREVAGRKALELVNLLPEGKGRELDKAVAAWWARSDPQVIAESVRSCLQGPTLLRHGAMLTVGSVMPAAVAHRVFGKVASEEERDPRPLLALASLYMRGERPGMAQRAYGRAVAQEPDLPEAWMGQGLLLELKGQLTEARRLYAAVATDRADLQQANLGLGRSALACGDAWEAEMGLLRALDRSPDSIDAKYMLALAYERQNRLTAAAALLDQVRASLDGCIGEEEGKLSVGGLATSASVLFDKPWPVSVRRRMTVAAQARVAAVLGQAEVALRHTKSLSTPLNCHELGVAGFAHLSLGQRSEAFQCFRKAVEEAPEGLKGAARAQLVKALSSAGEEGAVEAVEVARSMQATRPELLAALGAKRKDAELLFEATYNEGQPWANLGAQLTWKGRHAALHWPEDPEREFLELQRAVHVDPSRESSWAALAAHVGQHQAFGLYRLAKTTGGDSLPALLTQTGKAAEGGGLFGVWNEARDLFSRRVKNDPGSENAWRSLAWTQFGFAHVTEDAHDWRDARAMLQVWESEGAEKTGAIVECCLQLGEESEAEKALSSAAAGEDHIATGRAKARLALFRGHHKEALKLYWAAVKQTSTTDPTLLSMRNQSLVEMSEIFLLVRNTEAAEACLLEIKPRTASISLRLIALLVSIRGREEDAKKMAETYFPELPRDYFAGNFVLGLLALKCGAIKAAMRRLQRATMSDPGAPTVHEMLAQCHIRGKDTLRACKELMREGELHDCNTEAAALRTVYRLNGDKLALQRAMHLDPSSTPMWKEMLKG